MSLSLLREWQAWAKNNPLAFSASYRQNRIDWNAGMTAATFVNTMTAVWSKRGTRYPPRKFMFDPGGAPAKKKKQSPQQIYTMIREMAIHGMGATDPKVINGNH